MHDAIITERGAEPDGRGARQTGVDTSEEEPRKPRRVPRWLEWPGLVVVALLLALFVKTFLLQAFVIPSDSMNDTIVRGDRVLVDKLSPWFGRTPHRGEVVVFHDPGDWLADEPVAHPSSLDRALAAVGLMPDPGERDLIKRVIAVGGDTVDCRAGQPVRVNGKPLHEPYLYPGATPCDNDPVGTVTVPKDHLWVMGDHRNDSEDSRFHQLAHAGDGFVPVSDVIGQAVVIAWPVADWRGL